MISKNETSSFYLYSPNENNRCIVHFVYETKEKNTCYKFPPINIPFFFIKDRDISVRIACFNYI